MLPTPDKLVQTPVPLVNGEAGKVVLVPHTRLSFTVTLNILFVKVTSSVSEHVPLSIRHVKLFEPFTKPLTKLL